jgi:hypothetical protein
MPAHGAKAPILSDGDVGVVVHVHLGEIITNPKVIILEKLNIETGMKQIVVMRQWKRDCSVTILSQSWTPKIWATLAAFYLLLIWFYPPNGLEVTEFWRSTSLLISVSGQNNGWTELNFWVLDWPKLQKSQILLW